MCLEGCLIHVNEVPQCLTIGSALMNHELFLLFNHSIVSCSMCPHGL